MTNRKEDDTYTSVSPKQINGNDVDDNDEEDDKVDEDGEASEGEEVKEGEDVEAEPEQAYGDVRKMKKLLDPCLPTRAEREEHELTHLPFRNWCGHCVKGRGVEMAHNRSGPQEEGTLPEIHVDFCFPCGIGRIPTTIHEKACEAVGNMTVMAIRERHTRMALFAVVPRKGSTGQFAAKRAAAFCRELGYTGAPIIMKSDQEPAILALIEDVARWRAPAKTVVEQSPVGSSQSNGVIERAIQSYEAMLRTMRSALEAKWDATLPEGHPIFTWMSEYCGFLLNRFEVGADGKVAYERMKGKRCKTLGMEFAEGVWFKGKKNQTKCQLKWEEGIYLGVRALSGEIIVGDKEGVWKVRTCRRKPKEERWNQSNSELIGGVPWNTNSDDPEADGDELKGVIKLEARRLEEKEAEEVKDAVEAPRSFAITQADLEKYGYSEKCQGCKSRIRNTARQPHSGECRQRLQKLMAGETKVKEAKEKETEFFVKVHEDMQRKLNQKEEDKKRRKIDISEDHCAAAEEREEERPEAKESEKRKVSAEENEDREKPAGKKKRSSEVSSEQVVAPGDAGTSHLVGGSSSSVDEEGDLFMGLVEFASEVNGTEYSRVVNVESFEPQSEEDAVEAFDEITGEKLDILKLRKARNEEIEYIQTHNIWEKVPVSLCWEKKGQGPTSGKWVDVQKGDDVRSRYVGRDFKPRGEGPRAEIFASMPPLEAKKILISKAASQAGKKRVKKLLFVDIKKAHMNAICNEWAFVELPDEIKEPGFCARLKCWLYGMRPAARAWEEEYAGRLAQEGYVQGGSFPTVFRHGTKEIGGAVHGDDFTFLGYEEDLHELIELLKSWFELKVRAILGPDARDDKEIVILGRLVKWEPGGIRIVPDRKYADSIMKYCGLSAGSKSLGGPGKKEESEEIENPEESEDEISEEKDDSKELPPKEAKEYRGMAATANYLGADRCDVQYPAKELCRTMSRPTKLSLKKLKHLARYLVGVPEVELFYCHQNETDEITCYVDSDWAGCTRTRKSTSGGMVVLGSHCVKTWSSTQSTIALSSGEAEFYALIEGASRSLGIQSLMDDMGFEMNIRLKSDSSSGRSISLRKGCGKIRHLQVKYLWLQGEVFDKALKIDKVLGTENPADVGTKYLMGYEMEKVLKDFGIVFRKSKH